MTLSLRYLILSAIGFFAFLFTSVVILGNFAEARAGNNRSGDSRSSRSYDSPTPSTSNSSRQLRRNSTARPQSLPAAPSTGGFLYGLGTAMLGGFLGSLLFSSVANAGFGGLGGSGFGLLELMLITGLGYFLYRRFISPEAAMSHDAMSYQGPNSLTLQHLEYRIRPPVRIHEPLPLERVNYRSITTTDPRFTPEEFLKIVQDVFFKVQRAWSKQDTATLRSLCSDQLMELWGQQFHNLHLHDHQHKREDIALRECKVTEVWTEYGQDYISVRLSANLLDYTVDKKNGAIVSGSDSEPIEFEEYWTFSRPISSTPWTLSTVHLA